LSPRRSRGSGRRARRINRLWEELKSSARQFITVCVVNSDDEFDGGGIAEASAVPHETLKLLRSGGTQPLASLADPAVVRGNHGVVAEVWGQTDLGRVRQANEDQFLIASLERALLVEGSSLTTHSGTRLTDTPQGRMLIVADGIGGHGGGEVASAVVIDAMAHYAFETMPWVQGRSECSSEELGQGLRDALWSAQQRMRRVAQRKGISRDLGTTITMAYVAWPNLHLVHVGDSRAYLFRNDALFRLTRDHTLAQRLVDGRAMTEEQARHSHLSHVLVNAVGGRTDDLEIEVEHVLLSVDDQLLLCSDGLYDMVSDAEIAARLRRTDMSLQHVVTGLVDAANAAGGRDNVTVVVARF